MKAQNPDFRENVRRIFESAPFLETLGLKLSDVGEGWCESTLPARQRHLQQHGYIHAGVQATMADHTAGGAAATLIRHDQTVLTVEFKINLLRPASGDRLRCRSAVLKAGKTIIVAESEVFAWKDGEEKLAAKGTVTLAVVAQRKPARG